MGQRGTLPVTPLGYLNRPIANMATISPKRGFSVATVAKGWLLCLPVPLLERLQLLRRLFL